MDAFADQLEMSLVPVARSRAAPHHHVFHHRHLAADFERDYDASSGRQTQHRHEQEQWGRGQQSYQRVVDEWSCRAPGIRQCRSSRLETSTSIAPPNGHGQSRSTSSWRQQQQSFESSSSHVRHTSTRVTSSSMRLIETRVTASSSGSSASCRPRSWSSEAAVARGNAGDDSGKIDCGATTKSAFVSGVKVRQSSSSVSHHDRAFLVKEACSIGGHFGTDFGRRGPWATSPNPSYLPESVRSSSSGSSIQKDDLLLAITDLEVSAPLNHSFQLGKKNLSQKGSLSRRRRPSRSNLKANMSEMFQDTLDNPCQDTEVINGRTPNATSLSVPGMNGSGHETGLKIEDSSKKAISFTSLKSSSHVITSEKCSTNGEIMYIGTSSRDPDIIRDVKLSQNSALHNSGHQHQPVSGNWLTDAKRNLRKSSSNLFSATSPTDMAEVDSANISNRKYQQEPDPAHSEIKQKRISSVPPNSPKPTVIISNVSDLESPRLLGQSRITVDDGQKPNGIINGKSSWRGSSEKNRSQGYVDKSNLTYSHRSLSGSIKRDEHQGYFPKSTKINSSTTNMVAASSDQSSRSWQTTANESCDRTQDKRPKQKSNGYENNSNEHHNLIKSITRVEEEHKEIGRRANVVNGKRSSSVLYPKTNGSTNRQWETTSQSFNSPRDHDKQESLSRSNTFQNSQSTGMNNSSQTLIAPPMNNGHNSCYRVNETENGSKSAQDVRETSYSSNRNRSQSVTFLLHDTDGSETEEVDTEEEGDDEPDYGSSINMLDLEDEEDLDQENSSGGHSGTSNGKHLEKNKSKSTSNLDDDETIEAPWFRNSHYQKPERQGTGNRQLAKSSMNLKYISNGISNESGMKTKDHNEVRSAASPVQSPKPLPAGVAPWIHEVKLRNVTPPPPFLRRPGSQSPSKEENIAPWEVEEKRRRGYTLRSRVAEYGFATNGQVSPPVTVNGQKCKYSADSPQPTDKCDIQLPEVQKTGYSNINFHVRNNRFGSPSGDVRASSATMCRPTSSDVVSRDIALTSTPSRVPLIHQPPINVTLVTRSQQQQQQRPLIANGNSWNSRAEDGSPDASGDAIDPETKLPVDELVRRSRIDWTSLDRPKTDSVTDHVTHHWLTDVRLRRVGTPRSPSPVRHHHAPPSPIATGSHGSSPPPASMDLDEDDLTDEEVQRINRPDTPNGYGDDRHSEPSSAERRTADERWSAASLSDSRRPAVVPRADSADEITPTIVRLRSVAATAASPRDSGTSPALHWPRLRPVSMSSESRQATLEFSEEEERSLRTPNSSFDSDGNWRKPERKSGAMGLDAGGGADTPEWVNEAHDKRRSWANLNQIDFEMSQRAVSSSSDQSAATKPPWFDQVVKLKKKSSTATTPTATDGSSREASTGWKFVGRMSAPPPREEAASTSVDDEDDTADECSASSGGDRRSSSHTPDSQRTASAGGAPPPFDVENYVKELIARRKMRSASGSSPSPGSAEATTAADAENWLQMSLQKAKTDIDWNSLEKSRQSQREQLRRQEAGWLEAARGLRKSPRLARMTSEERRIVACLRPVVPPVAGDESGPNGQIDAGLDHVNDGGGGDVGSTGAPYDAVKSGLKHVHDNGGGVGGGGDGDHYHPHNLTDHQPEWMHTFTAIKKVNAVDWTKLDNSGAAADSNGQSASSSSSSASGTTSAPWVTQVQLRATGAPPEARLARPPSADSSFRLAAVDLKPVSAATMPPTAATLAAGATTNGVTTSSTTATGLKRVTFYIPKARSSPELREETDASTPSVERKEPEHPEWVKIAERKSRSINWEELDKPQESVSRSSRDSSGKWITQVHLKHVPPPLVAATVAPAAPSGDSSTDGQPSPPPQLRVRLRHVEPQQRLTRPPMTKSMSYDIGDLRRTTPSRGGATDSAAVGATNGNGLASATADKTLYSPQLAKRKYAPGEEPEMPDWMKIAERKRQAQVDWDQLEVARSSRTSSTSTLLEGGSVSGHDSEDPDESERADVFLSLQTSSLVSTDGGYSGVDSGSQSPWSTWHGRSSPGSMRWQSEPQLSVVAPPAQPSWLVQLAEKKRSAADVDWNNVAKDQSTGSRSPGGSNTTATTWLQEVRLRSPSLTRLDISAPMESSSSVNTFSNTSILGDQSEGDVQDGGEPRPASLPWSTGHSEVDRWQARYKDLFDDLADELEEGATVAPSVSGLEVEGNGDDQQKGVNHYCLSPFRKSLRTTSLENRQKRRMEMYQRHYSLPDLPNAMPRSVSELEIIQLERPEVIPETSSEEPDVADSGAGSDTMETENDKNAPIVFVKLRHTDRKPEGKVSLNCDISPAWLSEVKLRKTKTTVKDNSVRGRVVTLCDSIPAATTTNGGPKIDIRQSPTEPEPPITPSFSDTGLKSPRIVPEKVSRPAARSQSDSFLSIRDAIHRDLKREVEKREKRISELAEEQSEQTAMTPLTACRATKKLETKEQDMVYPGRGKPVWLEELKERKVALRSVSVENLVSEVAKSQKEIGKRNASNSGSPTHRTMRHSFNTSGLSPIATLPSFDNVLDQIKSMGKGQLFASLKRNSSRGLTQSAIEINKAEEIHEELPSSSSSSSSKSSSLEDSEEHSLTIGCFKAETIHHTSFIIPPDALHSSRPASRSPSFTVSHSESDFSIIINEHPEGEEEDPDDDFLHRRHFSPQRPASVPPSYSFSGPGSPRFMPGGVRRSASDYMSPRVISTIGKLQALNEDAIANRDELEALISKGKTSIPLTALPIDEDKATNDQITAIDQVSSTDQDLQSPLLLRNMMSSILSKACSDTNLAAIGVGRTTSAKTRFEATTNRMHASCSDLQSPVVGEDDSHSGEDRTNSSELGNSISEHHQLCRSELYIDVLPLDCPQNVTNKNGYNDQSKVEDDVSSKEVSLSSKDDSSSSSNKELGSSKEDGSSGMSIECPSPEFLDFTVTPTNGSGKQYTWTLNNGENTPKQDSSPDIEDVDHTVPSPRSQSPPLEAAKPSTTVSTTTTTTMVTESVEIESETVVEEVSETFCSSTVTTSNNNNCVESSSPSEVLLNVDFES